MVLSTDLILELYARYAEDLRVVRRRQYWFCRRHDNLVVRRLRKLRLRRAMLFPALGDLEAEITYLLIRDRAPTRIVELSPNGGWSTTWILHAIRDNANGGQLWSFDLHDTSTHLVPRRLARGRWHFVLGDAKETMQRCPDFDHLFIDSDHSRSFAEWYVAHLFPRIKAGTVVSVHDIFYLDHPVEEGLVVMDWLKTRGLSAWNCSKTNGQAARQRILEERRRLGFTDVIHDLESNPMLWFAVP